MQPGLDVAGTSHLFTSGNTWKEYSEVVAPTVPTTPTTPTTATTPTSATTATTATTPVSENVVYFNDSAIAVGNERYALYVWKSDSDNKWIDMTSAGSNLYQATLPSGYTNFIVVRMNGSTTTNSWDNMWNQSPDLTYSSSTNLVTATGWGSNGLFNVSQSAK